jgi:hypothetical protein
MSDGTRDAWVVFTVAVIGVVLCIFMLIQLFVAFWAAIAAALEL